MNAAAYVPSITPVSEAVQALDTRLPHNRYSIEVMGEVLEIDSPLAGRHQLRNVALAIGAAVELKQEFGYQILPSNIAAGVAQTTWPGRFQVIPGTPNVVLDVAHNPAGAWALRSTLSAGYEGKPLTIIFGVMRDKDIVQIAEILFPLAEEVIATRVNSPRAASPNEIRELTIHVGTEITPSADLIEAIGVARQRGRPIVITGSVYLVGAALELLTCEDSES
ncbi:MAG TPA: cyanophycin synthetase [Terriglobales bacterium]|nr:cyanophycin synthetase [Terriglobales bacterium]